MLTQQFEFDMNFDLNNITHNIKKRNVLGIGYYLFSVCSYNDLFDQ